MVKALQALYVGEHDLCFSIATTGKCFQNEMTLRAYVVYGTALSVAFCIVKLIPHVQFKLD